MKLKGSKPQRHIKHQYLQLFRVTLFLIEFHDIWWFGLWILNDNTLVLKYLLK